MTRLIWALGLLALFILILYGSLYIPQQTAHPLTFASGEYGVFAAFLLSGYVVGGAKPLWRAGSALVFLIFAEFATGWSVHQVFTGADPFYRTYEAPAVINVLFLFPAMLLSLIAFAITAFLTYRKR